MAEHGPLAERYINAVNQAFAGDRTAFEGLWADDCCVQSDGATFNGKERWLGAIDWAFNHYDWIGQTLDSSSEADGIIAAIGTNHFGDGTKVTFGGIQQFNADGLIVWASSSGAFPPR